MPRRLVNDIGGSPTEANNILIDANRGLSVRKNREEQYNYNTVYYFDRVIAQKYTNIKNSLDNEVATTELQSHEKIIDETPETGEKLWP